MEEQRQAELKRKLDAELAAKKASTSEVRVSNISYLFYLQLKRVFLVLFKQNFTESLDDHKKKRVYHICNVS